MESQACMAGLLRHEIEFTEKEEANGIHSGTATIECHADSQ